MSKGQPLQIITIDADHEGDSFILRMEHLNSILAKVPPHMKISVLAVVGAFRTGKSFLLNFFLRYLRSANPDDTGVAWMTAEGGLLSEGNLNDSIKENDKDSFAWRGGEERQTTGIWMWSEPFIRTTPSSDGPMAILLMDTQGMFDNETSMALTAQIFGLSTFISSFQIYNVDKRLQEDNLQHLALFSEYGRLAVKSQKSKSTKSDSIKQDESTIAAEAEKVVESVETVIEEAEGHVLQHKRPFQRIQFLIRDWQNFEADWDEAPAHQKDECFMKLRQEMENYLSKVFEEKSLSDLKSTRDQITRCFERVDCFMLPHPGFAVTKKTFNGQIDKIEPFFLEMVNKLCRMVFEQDLQPKKLNDRYVTAQGLFNLFEVFCNLFQQGNKGFPKAMTMLEATAEASNRTAFDEAITLYKSKMAELVNEESPYVKDAILRDRNMKIFEEALNSFDDAANIGSEGAILSFREKLLAEIEKEKLRFFNLNSLHNPFRDIEMYALPLVVGIVSWATATGFDFWCTSTHCEAVEDTFERVYMFVAFAILVIAYRNPFKDAVMYFVPIAVGVVAWLAAYIINSTCGHSVCTKAGDAFERIYFFVIFAAIVLIFKNFKIAYGYVKAVIPLITNAVNGRKEKTS